MVNYFESVGMTNIILVVILIVNVAIWLRTGGRHKA